jgi:glycerol-3-phosphate acyltransferase PlsX
MATSPTTRIALDAMGADRGPRVLIRGAIEAVHERPDIHVYLVGREKLIARMMTRMLKPYGSASHPRLQIIHAADVAGMAEKASSAVKRKDTSVNVAAQMVSEGKADALVSVGNTGAAKAAALFIMGRLKNVKRPALAALFPTADKPTMLMDVGATTDCKPEYLYQFAVMGNAYMKNVMGRPNPRIGVLSIGEEEGKGTELVTKTFDMLRASHMNFIGNAEGRDVMKGTFDVIVCDGFVGNSMLKMTEGTAYLMYTSLAAELKANPVTTMLAYMLKPAFDRFRKKLDWTEFGGAPLLGVNGTCIVGHGSSDHKAVKNAIRAAAEVSRNRVNEHIIAELEAIEKKEKEKAAS